MAAVVTRTGLILGERYRLDKRIAAGGVGQVWRATDLLLSRPVAVKVLRPEYADHPETLDRFRKEARHAGSISHAHVAQVFDYGPAGPSWPPYLVMEFVDGPSLADMLAVDPVEPAFALDVIAQAADGLAAAHRAGLVHRDVKPGNLLMGPEGQVKVTDFGIAYAAGQAPVTGPNLVMGTTQYMAPERIAGGPGTPASDLYALGIVLHECLTGVPPYEGAPSDVMAAHLYLPLPPLPANVPPELDDLVARLTAKDPAARISDARELATEAAGLRDAIAGGRLVPSARTASLSGSTAAVARPAVTAAAVPAGLSAALGTGQPGTFWPGDDQPPANEGGAGIPAGGTTVGGGIPAERSDEWAVPARMSVPGRPADPGADPRRRWRLAGVLGVLMAVLAGAALVGLLVAGALRDAPAGNPTPAGSSSPGATTPGGHATHGTSPVSSPAGGYPVPGAPASAGRATGGGGKTGSPSPSARSSSTASSSPGPTPSGSSSASPTTSSSPTPSTSPSPTPSASATTPVACVVGICL